MLWWLTQHLLVTAGLVAVVALACRFGRLSPALRHALWLVVLVKLLVPPLVALPWPEAAPSSTATASVARPVQPPAASPAIPPVRPPAELPTETPPSFQLPPTVAKEPASEPTLQPRLDPPGRPPLLTAAAPPEESALPGWSGSEIALILGLGVWAAGSLLAVGWHGLRIVQFQRRMSAGTPAPRWLKRLVRDLAGKFPVRPPRTIVIPGLSSPMLWCFRRPVLLWPASLIEPAQPQRWRGVVAHELAHLRRRDHWVGWLLLTAECLWWWNPLFWLIRRQLRLHAELACDAWVVWALPDDRRPYAEALLDVTEHLAGTLPAPVLGAGSSTRQALQRRLTMIMCESTPCRVPVRGLLITGLLALLLVPAWTLGDDTRTKKGDKNKAAEATLKKALADLEAKKDALEKEVEQLKTQLAELQNTKSGDAADRKAVAKATYAMQVRLAELQNQYANLVGNPNDSIWIDVSKSVITQPRSWGPEQATGAPNVPAAGDNSAAWASLGEDDQDEWLCLEYAEAVTPLAIMVYETYNPGALWKVSIFTEDDRELEVWKGTDPTAPGSGKGVSLIQPKVDFKDLKIKKVKLHLKSIDVKGWNEIDAVGLLDTAGKLQWAESATASSSYADRSSKLVNSSGQVFTEFYNRAYVNQALSAVDNQRVQQLEADLIQLKTAVDRLVTAKYNDPVASEGSSGPPPKTPPAEDPIQRLSKENQQLRDQMNRIEQMLINLQKRVDGK